MKDDSTATGKIRYIYEVAPEARLQTAHGVWGGPTAQGEIEINFYHEYEKLPEYTEQILAADGSLGHELFPDAEDEQRNIVRFIHSRVLLNYHTARAVLEWLEDSLGTLEEEGRRDMYDASSGVAQ